MKIVLIEECNYWQKPALSFAQIVIKVGRDPAECDLVFDPSEWPMVSRCHAEFRAKDGCCLLVDTNSTHGTFLNGERVYLPVAVRGGERVQFGVGGPVVVLALIEMEPLPSAGADFAWWDGQQPGAGPTQSEVSNLDKSRSEQLKEDLMRLFTSPRRVLSGFRSSGQSSKEELVDCTVFSPNTMLQGESYLVQVWAHRPDQAETASNLAKEFDDEATRRGFKSLGFHIARGAELQFHLSMESLELHEDLASLRWLGYPEAVQFNVKVPTDHAHRKCYRYRCG